MILDSNDDLRFAPHHQWVRIERKRPRDGNECAEDGAEHDGVGEGSARVGVTDRAIEMLEGRVVAVDLPGVGSRCVRGEVYGVLEGPRGPFDLVAPLSGKVVAVNDTARSRPDLVANAPFGDGWLVVIAVARPDEISILLSAGVYQ